MVKLLLFFYHVETMGLDAEPDVILDAQVCGLEPVLTQTRCSVFLSNEIGATLLFRKKNAKPKTNSVFYFFHVILPSLSSEGKEAHPVQYSWFGVCLF
jgi:hypothetical protein